ncbi:3-oxoacyl-ACP reductase FabG [Desulfurococcaceae archaeon MEX13E-LK6-19]|nr:3-oxoacyl-ACP reductase FabG [Desulfurococcaceae archaeon MEX13E-LK6-19]
MVEGYVLVTGGNRGIGRAIVLRFARSGYYVVYTYHSNRDTAKKVLEEIRKLGGEGFYVQMDVSDPESVEKAYKEIADKIPYLNVLVNNAGVFHDKSIDETTLEEWEHVIRVDLTGVFLVTKTFLPLLRKAPWASIVNIASLAGQTAGVASAAYSAAKGGVIALTKKLALELAPKIRVNAVAPSFVATDMVKKYIDTPEKLEKVKALHPLRDIARPEDVAEAVYFLATPASRFITGVTLSINGGRFMY